VASDTAPFMADASKPSCLTAWVMPARLVPIRSVPHRSRARPRLIYTRYWDTAMTTQAGPQSVSSSCCRYFMAERR
jgi:hypothetical protein